MELFWDSAPPPALHEHSPWKDEPCHVNCDCGRFLEIGDNVFMEYKKTPQGFERLAQQNVDFGGGLERMAAAVNDNPDIFRIDLFAQMLATIEELSGKTYGKNPEETKAFRVILDHLRASTFLIADGAPPSNRDQGYFTRRMVRRAVRFGNMIGLQQGFCTTVGDAVIRTYSSAYPFLTSQRDTILAALDAEESQFRLTLAKGERELSDYLSNHDTLDGAKAFSFFETYGFPLELTREFLSERGKTLEKPDDFEDARKKHQDDSRTASAGKFRGGLADHGAETTKLHTATHLLNAALRKVLGDHIWQKGSNITAERLRFDFTHTDKMTSEQIAEVERLVNEAISADLPVAYHVTTVDGAKGEGAIGVFDNRDASEGKAYLFVSK